MEKPKDRDFIETTEGLIFCVIGYLHPPDRYTSYLKYVPESSGKWSKGEARYSRVIPYYHVSQVESTYEYLRKNHPKYMFDCPVRNITISSVPKGNVFRYYKPRDRLEEILEKGPKDKLENTLNELVTILTGLSGLKPNDLGLTGSILTGSHNIEFSDIDLTIYGKKESSILKETIIEMRSEESIIQPFNAAKKMLWSQTRSDRFSISIDELMEFAERRWNYGIFRDTYFSIHPIRTDNEIKERYGDYIYKQICEVTGDARVTNHSESFFLPSKYGVKDVEINAEHGDITEIVSYEGLYSDMFVSGEYIEFKGILEQLKGKETRQRIIIGGSGSTNSYIKRINPPR
jgi:predicted nucleotidyltransferase